VNLNACFVYEFHCARYLIIGMLLARLGKGREH
jgi:hypothetical protein